MGKIKLCILFILMLSIITLCFVILVPSELNGLQMWGIDNLFSRLIIIICCHVEIVICTVISLIVFKIIIRFNNW